MAVENKSNHNWSETSLDLEGKKSKGQEIPHNRVLYFRYDMFKPDQIPFIKSRIESLIERILVCPSMKAGYIQEINKVILYEMGEL